MSVPYVIPSMQFKCLLMPFVSLLLIEILHQNSSKHFFYTVLLKKSFIFVMYKFVHRTIVLFDTIYDF